MVDLASLTTWWWSQPLATRTAGATAVVGLAVLCLGWSVRSAVVAFVGAGAWTPSVAVLLADLVSAEVGR